MSASEQKHTMGFDGFVWFQGVVEDRKDPLKIGRVRVRCLGVHTDDKNLIPTNTLPWAHVMLPITSASMSGLGYSPTGLVDGDWVFGFWRDGDACQEPVIVGVLPGIPEEPAQPDIGFYDCREELEKYPRKVLKRKYPHDGTGAQLEDEPKAKLFPREDHPWGCRINVVNDTDVNRFANNENTKDTIAQVKNDSRALEVPTALGMGGKWDEPPTMYDAQYPFNHVYESESGHIVEFDDTPNRERMHRWHRTGTFEEITAKGDKVVRVVRDNYEIILRENYIYICGNANVTVQGNINIYTQSNANIQVDKDAIVYVKGDTDIRTDGFMQAKVGKDLDVHVSGDASLLVNGDASAKVDGALVVSSGGNTEVKSSADTKVNTSGDLWIQTDGNVKHNVGGTYEVNSGGNMKFTAPRIDLN